MALEFTGLDCCVLLTRILLIEDGISPSFTSAKSVFSRKALVKMQLLKDVVGKDTYSLQRSALINNNVNEDISLPFLNSVPLQSPKSNKNKIQCLGLYNEAAMFEF